MWFFLIESKMKQMFLSLHKIAMNLTDTNVLNWRTKYSKGIIISDRFFYNTKNLLVKLQNKTKNSKTQDNSFLN